MRIRLLLMTKVMYYNLRVIIIVIAYFLSDSLDRKGVARVSDALQAHMWPDIRMKNNKGGCGFKNSA